MRTSEQEDIPEQFFTNIHNLFSKAKKINGGDDHYIKISDYIIKIAFADDRYIEYIIPAIAHLVCKAVAKPDYSILVWDSATTNTAIIPPAWGQDAFLAKGEIKGYNTATIKTAFQHGADSLNMVHLEKKVAIFWTRDFSQLPYYERSAPLKYILNLILKEKQLFLTHAACVGTDLGSVLMVGKGGSGKSTTALACLSAGLSYISDDYCLVSPQNHPTAFCIYNTAKMRQDSVSQFADTFKCFDHVPSIQGEKKLLFLHQDFSSLIEGSLPIKAILIPRIVNSELSSLKDASRIQALLALAPSTIFQLPGNNSEMLEPFKELLKKAPCYFLQLGRDISSIPPLIASLANNTYV